MSTDPISPAEIYATTHSPVSAPRQIGRVGSQGAPGISPRGMPTPFWPPRTLSPTGSGLANTTVPLHNFAIINSAAKNNLALIYPPYGAEIICRSLPHRAAPPWHPPYRDSPSSASSHAALRPFLQQLITVRPILRLLVSSVYNSVLRRIVTIATAFAHGLIYSMSPHGQPKRSHSPSVSYGVSPKLGYKNSHTLLTTGSYTLSRITSPALIYKRPPLHTVNCRRLRIPYRYGTGTSTNRTVLYRYRTGTVPYRYRVATGTVPVLSKYVQPRIPVPYATVRTVRYGTHSNSRVKLCAYNGAYTCPLHGHHSVTEDTL
jgi:hypothetical protein